jgi:glutamate-5-semialdehyde dehydrogenase
MSLDAQMKELASRSKAAAQQLTRLTTDQKNRCLEAMAQALCDNQAAIGQANAKDLDTAKAMGLSQAMIDRLVLNEARIEAMAQGLREVAALPDPVGLVLDERERPNGLILKKSHYPHWGGGHHL